MAHLNLRSLPTRSMSQIEVIVQSTCLSSILFTTLKKYCYQRIRSYNHIENKVPFKPVIGCVNTVAFLITIR